MRKILLMSGVVLLLFFALVGVAVAATLQDIYDDYADNGKLDGTYTDEELRAYLNDATLHQYGDPTIISDLDKEVRKQLGPDEFPFTGAQLGVIAAVAVVLIAGGVLLRVFTRKRA